MQQMRIAVIGAGISGLVSAYVLAKAGVDVVLYEKEDSLGGHAKTVTVDDGVDLDLGFMVFNRVTYPNMMEFFERLGIDMEVSDTSLSVSLDNGRGCEWGSRGGLSSLFSQKRNALNPYFWQMIREIFKFKNDVIRYVEDLENNADIERNETLGQFISSHGYSDLFQKAYLIPMCSSIWSSPSEGVMNFSAYAILSFCRNHHLLQLFGHPQWLTVRCRSHSYVNKVKEELIIRGCQILSGCPVQSVTAVDGGCDVICEDGSQTRYDGCIMAVHAPDALKILGRATHDETRVLGAFQYEYSDIYLHRDTNLMPKNPAAWSSWNFLGDVNDKVCLTYWLNVLQNISQKGLPYLVTLNPSVVPNHTLLKWTTGHPVPNVAATKASLELDCIQGKRGIWFCGAYQGYGFHEDGLKAGMVAANGVLGKNSTLLRNHKHMVLSTLESGARLFVTRFLKTYITTGCLILLEEGGTVFTFEGTAKKSSLKVYLRVHSPQFYWKIVTQADLGLADAYINGDFSFVDKKEGLLNIFMLFIANEDLKTSVSRVKNQRGWWTPMFLTAGIASAKCYFHHVLRQNTLTQARRNISRHYDLSNELFALFLDETMTYSCAKFKMEGEDLKTAQQRKISMLIEKARVKKDHEVLEIGCGWGSLAIEIVKRTGCKYTGITLSKEQLRYAEMKVKEEGLQNNIKFLLCDYRQLQETNKFDRIISCEMLEAVGHEYVEEFFGCCESSLADDGIFVLQFISIRDQLYDEHRRSAGFMKEYIFPGGCLLSLSRVTSGMAASSRLCVEHIENMGIHYYQTLRCWRTNFLENQSKIFALGFDQKFIRTWEYYFDYCAASFKTDTLRDYQVVFSRPGNVGALGNPYIAIPSAEH
ncbi:Cyclopropane-fatty-acyl-phospholipid synthase [Heracleum sosnowskyi]|uniref:Cyclopropane-fatty-acyl-phospholipid synthase n=1 Tax=Heracleum sosnowskyi TaxID=360622 RepID=A0AAD8H936_9APIA|nr:Cyclopropane-fatty-acyl-phospholipid synthase [Heracleum sosnowskyi]